MSHGNHKHGYSNAGGIRKASSEYKSWQKMRARCNNQNNPAYFDYGGRGICVCERWGSFEAFLIDMGERPEGTSLDRIDNERGYQPNNCRWATPKQQANNRRPRQDSLITIDGVTKTLREWCKELNLSVNTAYARRYKGWSDREILFGRNC